MILLCFIILWEERTTLAHIRSFPAQLFARKPQYPNQMRQQLWKRVFINSGAYPDIMPFSATSWLRNRTDNIPVRINANRFNNKHLQRASSTAVEQMNTLKTIH
jgi:hypothetical protein